MFIRKILTKCLKSNEKIVSLWLLSATYNNHCRIIPEDKTSK